MLFNRVKTQLPPTISLLLVIMQLYSKNNLSLLAVSFAADVQVCYRNSSALSEANGRLPRVSRHDLLWRYAQQLHDNDSINALRDKSIQTLRHEFGVKVVFACLMSISYVGLTPIDYTSVFEPLVE